MTPADWRALAERFEDADETTVYECVRELCRTRWLDPDGALDIRLWSEDELTCIDSQSEIISLALMAKSPDLLLGVVVACVPEGWWWCANNMPAVVRREVSFSTVSDTASNMDFDGYNAIPAAALGAAVCRAWAEVAGDQNTIKKAGSA